MISASADAELQYSLAYAELYLAVANLTMRYDFELYETTREDVDWVHDFTVPNPKLGSNLIRAFVKSHDTDDAN